MALCECEDNVLRCVKYNKAAEKPANDHKATGEPANDDKATGEPADDEFDEHTEFECVCCREMFVANDLLLQVSNAKEH